MILTVYGCNRLGTQITCDTDLSNQSQTVTQVKSADAWKDVFLVDDKGDRHVRAMGFFLNEAGAQRMDMVIPYGESSRYILVFNNVPAKVSSVTLKSSQSGLDVEGISVTASGAPAAGGADQGAASPGARAPHS
jgi:hypothetical protein